MSLSCSLLKPPLPAPSTAKPSSLTTPFLHGTSSKLPLLTKPLSLSSLTLNPPTTSFPIIKAMKLLRGRVVFSSNDKTVAVEVTRLAPHPKYKRRVRHKKKYQAHDPENRFKVGDWVELEECRPISKTKTFLAVPAPDRNAPKKAVAVDAEVGLPLQSEEQVA